MPIVFPPPAPASGPELIPLTDQFRNHDEFRLPLSDGLAGVELRLEFRDGPGVDVEFLDVRRLRWQSLGGLEWGSAGVDEYEAVHFREGVYVVTVARLPESASALIVLDRGARRAFVNLTRFVERDGAVHERTFVHQAGIDAPLKRPVPRTVELVGMRLAHRYSSTHVFEHVYLNPNTYAFQCLAGPEAGCADVAPADYWKLGTQLYLLSWHERLQPFNGAVVIDLVAGRAAGRLVGWDAGTNQALQVRTGSVATVLSTTSYEEV